MKRIAVFASGTGTNFEAIADAVEAGQLNAEITLVVVDKPGAPVIEKAQKRGIDVFAFNPKDYPSKPDYEREIIARCQAHGVEWIALAGYMRLLSPVMLEAYDQRIVNIHPSLLPAFKGKDAIGHGFLVPGMDGKPIRMSTSKVETEIKSVNFVSDLKIMRIRKNRTI